MVMQPELALVRALSALGLAYILEAFMFVPSARVPHAFPKAGRTWSAREAAVALEMAGTGSNEFSDRDRTNARAAFADSPELDKLLSKLNELRGVDVDGEDGEDAGVAEGAQQPSTGEPAAAAVVPRNEEIAADLESEEYREAAGTSGAEQPSAESIEAEGQEGNGSLTESAPAKENEALGAGGMADTHDPDEMEHEDPRKSVSAAPSFEEYLKMR